MSKITFTKTRNVKTPSQAYNYPAGIDFYVPEYSEDFINDLYSKNEHGHFTISANKMENVATITINPGSRVLIPSGIKVDFEDKGTCLVAANKSGVASKKGLIFGAQVVDADYHGEIHINLINTSRIPVSINTGDKVIQFLNLPVIYPELVEVSNHEYERLVVPTERGSSGFGSSGS